MQRPPPFPERGPFGRLFARLNEWFAYLESLQPASSFNMRTSHTRIGVHRSPIGGGGGGEGVPLQFKGQWVAGTAYKKNDIVIRKTSDEIANGRQAGTYIAMRDVPAGAAGPVEPNSGIYWETWAKGAWNRLLIREVTPFEPTAEATNGGTLNAFFTYYYKISSVSDGVEIESEEIAATTTDTSKTISLAWQAQPGSDEYRVYRSVTSQVYDGFSRIASGLTAPTLDDSGLGFQEGEPPGSSVIDLDAALVIGSDGIKRRAYPQELNTCEDGNDKRRIFICTDSWDAPEE